MTTTGTPPIDLPLAIIKMIRLDGVPAVGLNHQPPPPICSSSWSSLSPLAPPFTVDRPSPPPASPLRYALLDQSYFNPARSASPPSDAAYPWPTSASSTTTTTSAVRSRPSIRVVEGVPYYPLLDSEGCTGAGASPWNGAVDGEDEARALGADGSLSWMNPTSVFEASTVPKVTASFVECDDAWGLCHGKHVDSTVKKYHFGLECLEWLDNKHQSNYEENVRAPGNLSGMPVLGTSALQKGSSNFHSPDPISVMEEGNTYSNPSYDRHITQLVPCSTYPIVYYPDTYSSAHAYAPLAKRASSSMDCNMSINAYSTIQKGNPLKVNDDYADNIMTNIKGFSISQNAASKGGYIERSNSSNNIKTNNEYFMESSSAAKGIHLGNDSTYGNSTSSLTEVKSGSRIMQLHIPNPFPYDCGSAEPDDLMRSSSERCNQLYHAVDSPCWKGAPMPKKYPFVGEQIEPHPSVKQSNGSGYLVQGEKYSVSALNTLCSLEQDSLICTESRDDSNLSFLREFSPVSLPTKDKKLDVNVKHSNNAKVGNENGNHYKDAPGHQNMEVLKYQRGDSEPKECGGKHIGYEDSFVSADQLLLAGETNLETGFKSVSQECSSDYGKYSPIRNGAQVLVKAIHGLSEMLLSTYYEDVDVLEEGDQELVHIVVDNLKAYLQSKKSGAKHSSLVYGIETAQSKDIALKADVDLNQSNNKGTQCMEGRRHRIGSSLFSDKYDTTGLKGVAKDFGIFNGIPQVIEKALEESLHEQEENSQVRLYKTLWMEAEVTLCSLKFELQLERLKLKLENHEKQTKDSHDSTGATAKPMQVEGSSSLNSMHVLDGHDVPRCMFAESSCYNAPTPGDEVDQSSHQITHEVNTNKINEVDASVMARFRVLKSCDGDLSSDVLKIQPTKLGYLCSMERNQQPHAEAEPRGGGILMELRSDIQNPGTPGANYNEENGLYPKSLEHARDRGSQVLASDGPQNQHAPNRMGKLVLSGGYDSASSEWEHVLEGDLTWYDNPI